MRSTVFKTEKIRKDIFELVDNAPFRSMYGIVMSSIDFAMQDLLELREQIPKNDKNKKVLEEYDAQFESFGEREAYYFQSFSDAEDRSVVDAPLFYGDYSGFEFSGPSWPDIETPFRMANKLSKASALAGMDEEFLDLLRSRFEKTISDFWAEAARLIELEKASLEAGDTLQASTKPGRRYGFLPYVVAGAVVVVGVLGAAAGYSFGKGKEPEQYVEEKFWGKHKKSAKNIGIGFAAGALFGLLIFHHRR